MHSTCELPGVPGSPEQEVPDPTDSGHLRQSFSSLVVPVCPGAAGRRISLARGADDPGSPVGTALAQVVESKAVGMAGRVDVGPIRQGNGLGAATAPLDGTDCALIPLCGRRRGCPHPHAHTRTLRGRSTRVHVSPTSRTYVWRAYPWRCAMCRYVYAWRAQQCTAQCSANTRTYTTLTHTQHCHFTSTTTFHRPPPERARVVARRRLYCQRGSDRSAGRDRLRSNAEKEGVPTSTRTHPHTESAQHPRAHVTHVTHLRLARVPVALCYVSVCE